MKRISLKLKLTLLYTFFMAILTCAALAILFSLSSRELLSSVQSRLERRVQDSVDALDYDDGELEVDSDFYSVTRDIYLSLYDSDMYFLYGKVPQGFDQQPELEDGVTRTIKEGNDLWYVYDLSFRLAPDYTVYVRGITSVTEAETSFTITTLDRVFPPAADGLGDSDDRISLYKEDASSGASDHIHCAGNPGGRRLVPPNRSDRSEWGRG